MADTQHPGGKIARYTITNSGRGGRYVNDPDGVQHLVPAGGNWTGELTAAEAKAADRYDELTVKAGGKAPKADAKPGQEGGGDNQDPSAAAYVAHEGFGKWFAYTADGEKVADLGPFTKDEAATWATENKAEVRTQPAN